MRVRRGLTVGRWVPVVAAFALFASGAEAVGARAANAEVVPPPESAFRGSGQADVLRVERGSPTDVAPLESADGSHRPGVDHSRDVIGSSADAPMIGANEVAAESVRSERDGSKAGKERAMPDGFVAGRSVVDEGSVTGSYREFKNPDGSRTAEVASGPVRFKNSRGVWVDYDMTLVAGPRGGFVPASADRSVGLATGDGVALDVDGIVFDVPDVVSAASGSPDAVPRVERGSWMAGGNGVALGRAGGNELVVSPMTSGAELSVRFGSRASAGDGSWVQRVEVPDGTSAVQDGSDGVVFVAKDRRESYRFGGGRAFDARGSQYATGAVSVELVSQAGNAVVLRVGVDTAWLDRSDVVFPVTVDPPIAAVGTVSGDSYVSSAVPTGTGGSYSYINSGSFSFGGIVQEKGLIGFDLPAGALGANRVVRSATLSLYQNAGSSPACTTSDSWVAANGGVWYEPSVSWNTFPSGDPHPAAFFQAAVVKNMTCAAGFQSFAPLEAVQRWITNAAGSWGLSSQFGVRVTDTAGLFGLSAPAAGTSHQFASHEAGAWVAPTLSFTYEDRPLQPAEASASPADGASFVSTTPTLSAAAVTDPDGDPARYWFRVWTSRSSLSTGASYGTIVNDVGGEFVDSGWVSTPSWTVPAGALADGGYYYWTVVADDGHSPAAPARWFRSFFLDSSGGGRAPSDGMGPVGVSLVDGSYRLGASTFKVDTVSGTLGVDLDYDSGSVVPTGLTGEYFKDVNNNNAIDSGVDALLGKQNDRLVSYEFRAGDAPFPRLSMVDTLIRWRGSISVPTTGSYTFGTPLLPSTGINVKIGATTVLAGLTAYSDGSPYASGTAISLTGGTSYAIEIVARLDLSLGASFHLQYSTGSGQFYVPGSWLTPEWSPPATMSDGWSADVAGDAMVSKIQIDGGDQAILLDGAGEQIGTFTRETKDSLPVWKAEPDLEGATLIAVPGGKWQLSMFGTIATFTSDGLLEDERDSDEATNTSGQTPTLQYTYAALGTSGGTRLTRQFDPVTSRAAYLVYAGMTTVVNGTMVSCDAPPAGLLAVASLPAGRLCKVLFVDGAYATLGTTNLFYFDTTGPRGALARVHTFLPGDPNTSLVDLSYSGGYVNGIRDPLNSAAAAAGVASTGTSSLWQITRSGGKVSSITAPEPSSGAARPARTFAYGSGWAEVSQAGFSPPTGWARRVTYDASGAQLSETGPDGLAASTTYDAKGRVVSSVAAGFKTTYEYDVFGRPLSVRVG